jgi:hypothetical protein
MSDTTRVQGPVDVRSDSPERVAYELMTRIDGTNEIDPSKKNEAYWLSLYHRCYRVVVRGNDPKDIK